MGLRDLNPAAAMHTSQIRKETVEMISLTETESTSSRTMQIHRMISLWMFGDVMYALLPIATLWLITHVRGEGFVGFGLIKEWSFAAIVLFGVAIRRVIRLKTEIQRSPRSYKLDTAVQGLVLFLVMAVLVLALVILHEKGVAIGGNTEFLGFIQVMFFSFGAFILLIATVAEEAFSAAANRRPLPRSTQMLAEHILYRLNSALETLTYVSDGLQRLPASQGRVVNNEEAVDRGSNWIRSLREHVDKADELMVEIRASVVALEKAEPTASDGPTPKT
jgi:hypothetical protein